MRLQLRSLLAVLALGIVNPVARAADITFDFGTLLDAQSSYSTTNGIYMLTLLNPVKSGDVDGVFTLDEDGIFLGSSTQSAPFNAGFSMQITGGALDFKNYVIGYLYTGSVGTFSLTGGTGTSTGNVLNPMGTYNFNGSYTISPGDTVILNASFTAGIMTGTMSQIKSITFTTSNVPEPSTYILGGLATGVMALVARRRKANRKG